jgi:RNA polymerase sigma-70 factor (ECF subfamily)
VLVPSHEAQQRLLERCRAGEKGALGEVFRTHAPTVGRLLRRLAGPGAPAAEVEDLLQETLAQAITAFPRFRGEASVQTWLCRIAVNVFRAHTRRPDARPASLELLHEAHQPVDPLPWPDRATQDRQLLARIYHHLEQVPEHRRVPFILHVLEGRPVDEVAALTGSSELAARARIFWARRTLMQRARRDPALRELVQGEKR